MSSEVPNKKDKITRRVRPVEELDPNVIAVPGHWYLPEEKSQDKRIWEVHMNLLTELRDDYDPVIGGSGCRAVPARIRKM